MRVTNGMMISNMLKNLNSNLNVMSRKQDELSTGKKVIFASDNPVAAAKILKFKTDIADMEQYSTNTRDAKAWLDASESAIAEIGSVLQRIRELTVQGANGTNTPTDTQKIAEEIKQLRSHIMTAANTNFAGRYIFSSHFTDRAVLDADGNYNIPITAEDIADKPVATYEISAREYMPIGVHGLSILGTVADTSAYQTVMPDQAVKGTGAEKPAIRMNLSLTQNYSAGANMEVTLGGNTYTVDKSLLSGSALKPLELQKVLNAFNSASDGSTELSNVADIYFDNNKNLVIRSKTSGAAADLSLSNFAGVTEPTDITNINAPAAMAAMTDLVSGSNAAAAVVTAGTNFTNADAASFQGKSLVMTVNGVTKVLKLPDSGLGNAAQVQSALQTEMDAAFGAGKVTATVSDGAPISFATVTAAGDPEVPSLRIQPVKTEKSQLMSELDELIGYLSTGNNVAVSNMLGKIDAELNNVLAVRADIGARTNRLDLVEARIAENSVTFTRLLSDSQDADMAEVIMFLKNAENVYKAALSVGGKVIQPSLMDFLR